MRWRPFDYYSESDCGYRVSVVGGVYSAWAPGRCDGGSHTLIGCFDVGVDEVKLAAAVAACEQHLGVVNGQVD